MVMKKIPMTKAEAQAEAAREFVRLVYRLCREQIHAAETATMAQIDARLKDGGFASDE